MSTMVIINEAAMDAIDRQLSQFEIIHRLPAVLQGMQLAGKVVEDRAFSKLPGPGYPGDKKGKKPLRDALSTKVKDYPSGRVVSITGYAVPAGAHGHNVEEGHDIVVGGTKPQPSAGRKSPRNSKRGLTGQGRVAGRVAGRHDLRNAGRETEAQQGAAIERELKQLLSL